jgi:hypothetical protein
MFEISEICKMTSSVKRHRGAAMAGDPEIRSLFNLGG